MKYRVDDRVVYKKSKQSEHPGPRAEEVYPSPHGELYAYVVDKYWRVASIVDENTVEIVTRTGKRHDIPANDPRLRKANLFERLTLRHRFPDTVQSG